MFKEFFGFQGSPATQIPLWRDTPRKYATRAKLISLVFAVVTAALFYLFKDGAVIQNIMPAIIGLLSGSLLLSYWERGTLEASAEEASS